ncbi:hypothetical protein D3C84_1212010 [compost metagenome]
MTIGAGQGAALLVGDIDIAGAGTAVPITDCISAVIGLILGIGVVDRHGQCVVF